MLWSSHNIEHVFHHEAADVCAGFAHVLKKTGWAIVTCPDINTAIQFAAKHGIDGVMYQSSMGPITPRDIIFGHQKSIQQGNDYMAHRNGFDLKSLRDAFLRGGFSNIYGERRGRNLWFIAGKSGDTDKARGMLHKVLGVD